MNAIITVATLQPCELRRECRHARLMFLHATRDPQRHRQESDAHYERHEQDATAKAVATHVRGGEDNDAYEMNQA